MARINAEEKELIKKLTSDNVSQSNELKFHKKKKRKMKPKKSNKLLVAMIVVVVIFFMVTAMAAQTGIWQIPVFTQVFYRIPEPIRVVESATVPGFNQQNVSFDEQRNILRIEVTEEELTAIIKQQLSRNPDPSLAPNSQIVITPQEIEFFGFLLKPFKANLTVKIKPQFKDEKIDYKISQTKIGSLNLPPSLVNWALKTYIAISSKGQQDSNAQQLEFYRDKIKPESFQLAEGKLSLEIFIDVEAISNPISQNIDKVINIFSQLDPEEITKLNNFDFENLNEATVKLLEGINVTTEVLQKFMELNSKQSPAIKP